MKVKEITNLMLAIDGYLLKIDIPIDIEHVHKTITKLVYKCKEYTDEDITGYELHVDLDIRSLYDFRIDVDMFHALVNLFYRYILLLIKELTIHNHSGIDIEDIFNAYEIVEYIGTTMTRYGLDDNQTMINTSTPRLTIANYHTDIDTALDMLETLIEVQSYG